jgi:hypothetical protein
MPKTQKSTIENWLIGRLNAETNDSLLSQKYDFISYFSMTYNLFESVVFDCDAKIKDIEDKASFFLPEDCHCPEIRKFHTRYKSDKKKIKNLFNRKSASEQLNHHEEEFSKIIAKNFEDLEPEEKYQIALYTIIRYRNNLFHGNKGLSRWLVYKEQIIWCTTLMQFLITLYDEKQTSRILPNVL